MSKTKTPKIVFPTVNMVAAAITAYRLNSSTIQKYDSQDNAESPVVRSNKTIITEILRDMPELSESEKAEANEIIHHIQNSVTMALLAGKNVSPFLKSIAATLELEQLAPIHIRLVSYAPNIYFSAKKREDIEDQFREVAYTSQPLGNVGDKVSIEFTIINIGL